MSLDADYLVDRRRLRRQLSFWRVLAFTGVILALLGIGYTLFGKRLNASTDHIARVRIEGMITGQQETLDLLDRVGKSGAKAVILRINSGGGTTSGSEALYEAIRRVAAKKPVIAVIDGVGASGAYMAAIGAERIFASRSAIVGSIGVIAQIPNVTKLLDTLGVKVESVRSSPLKAMPSGVEATSPEARAALDATVQDTYRWFRGLVGERRALEAAALDQVADGRVFTGQQALGLKLIDSLGGEVDAVAWLEAEKKFAPNLPVRTYSPPDKITRFPGLASLETLGRMLGLLPQGDLEAVARAVFGTQTPEGLVSLWHPAHE
jgi:protease IV